MNREVDLRDTKSQEAVDSWVDAQTRFEENRRYDHRPAIQQLDRAEILVTTRTAKSDSQRWGAGLIATIATGGCLLALTGFIIGRQAQDTAAVPPAAATAPPDTTTPPTTTPVTADSSIGVSEPSDSPASPAVPLEQTLGNVDLTRLSFQPGTAELTQAGQLAVSELAKVLIAAPDEPVEVMVRTFSETTPGLNHGLSVRQAEVILQALTVEGVNPDRLRSVGLGSSGAERPSASAAIRTEASDEQLTEMIRASGPVVLEDPFAGSFDEPSSIHLAMIGEYLENHPETAVTLVGYAWSDDTVDDNHARSHTLLDAAMARIIASGASETQVALVGLGEVSIQLADQLSEVQVDASPAAAIGVSLGAVEVESIAFETGSATLTESGGQALAAVAEVLALDESVQVEVAVHTYTGSSSQENHDLSQRQADAIFEFLTNNGISPNRIELVAHGDPHHFSAPGREGAVTFTVIR